MGLRSHPFAQRVCPGIHIARNSIVGDIVANHSVRSLPMFSQEINVMKLIWTFNFSKSKDPTTERNKVYDLNDFVKVRPLPISRDRRSSLIGSLHRVS